VFYLVKREDNLETTSIRHILSMLTLGGQCSTIVVQPVLGTLSGDAEGEGLPSLQPKEEIAPWYAYLSIEGGQVGRCELFNAQGVRYLVGKPVMAILEQSGRLRWHFVDESPLAPQTPEAPPPVAAPEILAPAAPAASHALAAASSASPASPPDGPDASPARAWKPTRTALGDRLLRAPHKLSRKGWQVLALLNGQYTVEELSQLLGDVSITEVLEMLRSLLDLHFIQ
jgi:hypothetical protein